MFNLDIINRLEKQIIENNNDIISLNKSQKIKEKKLKEFNNKISKIKNQITELKWKKEKKEREIDVLKHCLECEKIRYNFFNNKNK